MPVVASAYVDLARLRAPSAIVRATRSLTAPCSSISFGSIPRMSIFASFEQRLAHIRNLVKSPLESWWTWDNRTQGRHPRYAKHRLQLARRARQKKDVWRTNLRIDIGFQIQSRPTSVFVWQNLRAVRHLGLVRDAGNPFDSARFESLFQ